MSRHRNVRSMNYEDEYYDDDDDYSRSFEDNYCISPGTVAQFTWNRDRNTNLASYMGADEVINEVDIEEDKDQDDSSLQDSFNVSQARSKLNDTDKARLNSCLEEIHNIMGDTVPESIMVDAILRNQFIVEKSLNELLSPQDAPKPQRQPRNRNKSQDDSDDTNELNKLLADIQSLESMTKPEYHAPSLLRFKSNPGSDEVDSCLEVQQMSSKQTNTKDVLKSDLLLKGVGVEGIVPETHKNSILDASPSSLGSLQKGKIESTSLSKPKVSLAELAKQSNSSNIMKETQNNSKLRTKAILKEHSHSHNDKTFDSGKVSLADLAKQSNDAKGSHSKLSKETNVNSFISDLSTELDKNLIVHSSPGTKKYDSVKLSLADLAKQHKSNAEGALEVNKTKLGDSSSAFVAQHLANKNIKGNQCQNKTSGPSTVSTPHGKGNQSVPLTTPSSQTSLSELANRHKTKLSSSHGGLKKDPKIGSLSALIESHKSSGPHSSGISSVHTQSAIAAKQISGVRSAEASLAKLSLTSCLRSSKQNSGSVVSGKAISNPEYLSDLSHFVSSDSFKENKGFVPARVFEKADMSLVSLPSNSAVVFCNIVSVEQNSLRNNVGVKRKINYPSFACDNQVKKRRILYPQQKLHQISPFDFSSMSPDDIVKKKQKQAFVRSNKEFSVSNSSHS